MTDRHPTITWRFFCVLIGWLILVSASSLHASDLTFELFYSRIGTDLGVMELLVRGEDTGHSGLASYSLQLGGTFTELDHRSPNGFGQSVLGFGAIGFGGFGRSPDGNGLLTASQDTITGSGMIVYDFGSSPGTISETATPLPLTVFAQEQPHYGALLQIARGSWSGSAPSLLPMSVAANVFRPARDGSTRSATSDVRVVELLPGDANRDGVVDASDFNIWNVNKFTSGTDWGRGDFSGDGVTDVSDFTLWNANKFTSLPLEPLSVPESLGSGWLALLPLIGWIESQTRRRKNQSRHRH